MKFSIVPITWVVLPITFQDTPGLPFSRRVRCRVQYVGRRVGVGRGISGGISAGAQWAGARAITLLVAPCGQKIELVSAYRGVGEQNFFLPITIAHDSPGYPVVGAGGTLGLIFD